MCVIRGMIMVASLMMFGAFASNTGQSLRTDKRQLSYVGSQLVEESLDEEIRSRNFQKLPGRLDDDSTISAGLVQPDQLSKIHRRINDADIYGKKGFIHSRKSSPAASLRRLKRDSPAGALSESEYNLLLLYTALNFEYKINTLV